MMRPFLLCASLFAAFYVGRMVESHFGSGARVVTVSLEPVEACADYGDEVVYRSGYEAGRNSCGLAPADDGIPIFAVRR